MTISPILRTFLPVVLAAFLATLVIAPDTRAEAPRTQSDPNAAESLFVVSAIVDPVYEPIAPGFAEWVRVRARDAGLDVVPGSSVRRLIAAEKQLQSKASEAAGTRDIPLDQTLPLRLAREYGARNVLLIDLRSRNGRIEADFRLYETLTGTLSDGGVLDAPAGWLVFETEQALDAVDKRLGANRVVRSPDELRAVDLGALSATTRALVHLDQKRLGEAWHEVAGRSDLISISIQRELDRVAAAPTTSATQLAQLANAKGDARRAWRHISEAARESYRQPAGAASTLTTAAEVQLALGAAPEARSFYNKALEVEPTNVRANMGLAQVLALEGRADDARVAFEEAAALDLESPVPFELAAETSVNDPALKAEYLLKAGSRHAARFESETAQLHFARAIQLDPKVAPRAARESGDLYASVGEFDEALEKYGEVRAAGHEEATLLVVEARTQHAAGLNAEAVASYEKVLTDYDQDHTETLVELGALYVDEGRAADAVPLLETASELEPDSSTTNRSLARALAARNTHDDRTRALELFADSEGDANWEPRDLRAMAALQAEAGNFDAATETLERAAHIRELDAEVQRDIAALMKNSGGRKSASMWADRFVKNGIDPATESGQTNIGGANESRQFQELNQLIASFGARDGAPIVAAFHGLREPMAPEELVLDWLMPRTTNMQALDRAIRSALEVKYVVTNPGELGENFAREAENLFLFDEKVSLNIGTFTDLNISYDTDAVFVARLIRTLGDRSAPADSCWHNDHYALQMRRLSGRTDDAAKVLSNHSCLAGGIEGSFGMWNQKAAASYSLFLILFLFPFVRGWGRLEVEFLLPDGAAAMFAVSLTRRPSKVRDPLGKSGAGGTSAFRNQLRRVSGSERRLEGSHMSFTWVPARRSRYYLTIRGPLVDLGNNSLIGEFLEERTVKIERGKITRFEFDLCTHEAMVNVVVKKGDHQVPRAQVALRGVPGSTRFCPEGKGVIYAPVGEHVLVVGAEDRVAEQTVRIEGVAPVTVTVNLDYEFVFEDCPAAVEPYLEADYLTASRALAEAGQEAIAKSVADLRAVPVMPAAAAVAAPEPAISSQHDSDAQPLGRSQDAAAVAARVHDEAGEYALAAEAYREVRDLVNAARCYVEVYDWPNAIECYQDLGDTENLLCLLERSGEYYDAGILAGDAGQHDRAIHDLQQVDTRHPRYIECCRKLAEILGARGDVDLALEKFDEGMAISGTTEAPLEMLNSYASLLENAERFEEALSVYEGIRRRDMNFENVKADIERVRKELSHERTTAMSDDVTRVSSAKRGVAQKSRYEIQSELGRGGMGVVYRALDTHLQRTVALKVLPEHLREHEAALALFLREARSAAALNHRNIVTVYDAGQEGEMDFISMECLEGTGLDAVLKRHGALQPQVVAGIGLQVAAGLDYAQKHKIIHRDIKPSNLFLTTERVVKIMDFGLAKMVEEVRRASTIIGGTPNYMAPEQAIGNPTDHRADLYAMGGTLFHLLTGTVPYETGDVTYQHAHSPPPDPRERVATVDPRMAQLVMKLMAKAPEDRYQSAREVAVDLSAFLKSLQ